MVAGGAYRGRMRRVSKIGVPLGLAVVAGVTGGLVALGVANAGQQPRGDNRVVSDISSASPTASPSATASPTVAPTAAPTTAAPAPTQAARQAQAVETTDPATDPTTDPTAAAPTDDPTTADPAPTGPINRPIEPIVINPGNPIGPGQG